MNRFCRFVLGCGLTYLLQMNLCKAEESVAQPSATQPAETDARPAEIEESQPQSPTERLQQARIHLQHGRYAEAEEVFEPLQKVPETRVAAALGQAEIDRIHGRWKQAETRLRGILDEKTPQPDVLAHLAEICFETGRYEQAETLATETLQSDQNHLRGRLVQANLHAAHGHFDKALAGYVWFVRYYNRFQPTKAAELFPIAEGSLQYARWKGSSGIFRFVVNTLAPDALKDDPLRWEAHALAGRVLLEKYNYAQGIPELQRGLAINPRAVPILMSLARAAHQRNELEDATGHANTILEINPRHVGALLVLADIAIQAGRLDDAQSHVDRAANVNAVAEPVLARQVAIRLFRTQLPTKADFQQALTLFADPPTKQIKPRSEVKPTDDYIPLFNQLAQQNRKPGRFLNDLGELLEGRRKFEHATLSLQAAIDCMPQLAAARTNLGMLLMRIGKTDEAETILNAAFKADPFHVRVSNLRKVIGLLKGYATVQTDHFIIRYDNAEDEILSVYLAEYLEEIYPQLTKQFGFEPESRTIFEIYHNGKGETAHEWFSARMVGLPWIQTIGASTGVIVALASPTASEQRFNWASVLKHEFVHILNLQQTKFNCPHWLTEALAVTAEGYPRSDKWNELLLERVPAGRLRPLTKLNDGFIRPESPDDWQFAYCQSRLYAQYIIETFGETKIAELLNSYRDGLATEQVIERVFSMPLRKFEAGYVAFVKSIVSKLQASQADEPSLTLAEAEKAFLADPKSIDAQARYADLLLQNGQSDKARTLAEQVQSKQAKHPLAALVLARILLREREFEEAVQVMEQGIDRAQPHPRLLELLAKTQLLRKQNGVAAEWFLLGRQRFPYQNTWRTGLARAYAAAEDHEKLIPILEELTQHSSDDPSVRKTLMKLAFADKNYPRTIQYGMMTIHIDPLDADVHSVLGQAYWHQQDYRRAVREFEFALKLEPDNTTAAEWLPKAREKLQPEKPR